MSPETYENDVFQNKNYIQEKSNSIYIQQQNIKRNLKGHTELLMLPKNKSSNCSLLIHFFNIRRKRKKLLRFTFIPVYNVDVLWSNPMYYYLTEIKSRNDFYEKGIPMTENICCSTYYASYGKFGLKIILKNICFTFDASQEWKILGWHNYLILKHK